MNQNKARLIQTKIDDISTSVDAMIAKIMAEKNTYKNKGITTENISHSIIKQIPSYYNAINVISEEILDANKHDVNLPEEIEDISESTQITAIEAIQEENKPEEVSDNDISAPIIKVIPSYYNAVIASKESISIDVEQNPIDNIPLLVSHDNYLIEKNIDEEEIDKGDFVVLDENKSVTDDEIIEENETPVIAEETVSTIDRKELFIPETEVVELNSEHEIENSSLISTPLNDMDFDLDGDFDNAEDTVVIEKPQAVYPNDKIEEKFLDSFLEEWEDFAPQIDTYIFELQNKDESSVPSLHRDLHTLKGNAGLVGALRLREKIHGMESIMQNVVNGFKNASDIAEDLFEQFEETKIMVQAIQDGVYDYSIFDGKNVIPIDNHIEKEIEDINEKLAISPIYTPADDAEEFVEEQWAIFIEEYEDLTPKIEENIGNLNSGDKNSIIELNRDLHSMKGSVGTTGALKARKAIHEIESAVEKIKFEVNELDKPISKNAVKNLKDRFNFFKHMVEEINKGNFEDYEKTESVDNIVVFEEVSTTDKNKKDAIKKQSQEGFVKVDVGTLNFLSNEINEVKLGNASNDTSLLQLFGHMREFEENVNILSKMLRDLEIETESQMQSRKLQIEEAKLAGLETEMDSLEFDRYETIHELVGSFSEGVSDTYDIYQNCIKVISEMQANSIVQNRSIIETQESLTKARLIPFSSRSDSLQSLVKSTASALNKKARLMTENDSVEVDRALLDKLKYALDHALRNCLTHGIEMPEIRKALGKREEGTIQISVKQEGGRLYISIEDDGAGINVAKVREKAIEKGLWDESQPMSDAQATDIICLPSFSTADSVNNHAGRGVGLDVVRNDILNMGGKYEIFSTYGKGMKVDIQIPTSISTVFALIVTTGTETFAIPVDIIEEVKFLNKEEVFEANTKGKITVLIDEKETEVDFRYLSELMGLTDDTADMATYKHLVVCRDGDNIIAVLVDKLSGVKELPIKPLGRTLSSVPGVVSATILPDGVAAFIIDPSRARTSLLRYYGLENKDASLPNKNIVDITSETVVKHSIMVVDDSLTVRKATARFLQKEGYEPILAKNGQNALEMLATLNPELILLDVEMPKMDGFAFAKHVREHRVHANIPIIMITSRTAPKHKNRAEALGVNEYMGKPFKEEELLQNIKKYIPED